MAVKQRALPVSVKVGRLWNIPVEEETYLLQDYERYSVVVPGKSWYTLVRSDQESYWVLVRMDLEGWAR